MSFNITYRSVVIVLITVIFSYSCQKDVPEHDLDAEITDMMEKYGLPSVSACVIHEGAIMWQGYYGYSDVENQVEPDIGTIYYVASVSKLFILTAVMQLEEQGLIDLDNDINDYLPISIRNPNFPDIPVTARILLTHTSGLNWPRYDWEVPGIYDSFPPDEAPRPTEWIPEFLLPGGEHYTTNIWKETKPGEFEYYSNIGSNVLAYIVEQVSGMDFREYCKERIFLPLGMMSTSYNYADLNMSKLASHYKDDYSVKMPFDDRVYASGGLKTTIHDLSIFLILVMNEGKYNNVKLLEERSIEKMLSLQNGVSGRCLIWKASLGGWHGHTGGLDAASSSADIHSGSKTGIIIFCNKHNSTVYPGHEIHGLVRQKANEYIN